MIHVTRNTYHREFKWDVWPQKNFPRSRLLAKCKFFKMVDTYIDRTSGDVWFVLESVHDNGMVIHTTIRSSDLDARHAGVVVDGHATMFAKSLSRPEWASSF